MAGGGGVLRETMPKVAQMVDELRQALGRELVDRQIAKGMKGQGTFYAWERGTDGVLRDCGSWRDGKRVQLVDGQVVPPAWTKGVAPCIAGTRAPKQRGRHGEDS